MQMIRHCVAADLPSPIHFKKYSLTQLKLGLYADKTRLMLFSNARRKPPKTIDLVACYKYRGDMLKTL